MTASSSGRLVILGPPGTGKTSRVITLVQDEIEAGTPPDRIAFLTFTRAAREEAVERLHAVLGLGPEAALWFRTIHSTAYRLLGLKGHQVMGPAAWEEFGNRYGYEFTRATPSLEDPLSDLPRHTDSDLYRYTYQWGRNRMLDQGRALNQCPIPVSAVQFNHFVSRLIDFKNEGGLLDFTDMLELVLERGARPGVDVIVVDEAQDLSPLQIAVVELWMESCRRVYVAGDDDQAIYAFQGADSAWLLGLSKRWPVEILQQSYRVPMNVFAVAQSVIGRNRLRIEKPYRPKSVEGVVDRVGPDDIADILDPGADTLVLVRNREFLRSPARALFDRRVPYVVEGPGGISPLSDPDLVRAVRTSAALFCRQPVDAIDLSTMLKFIPSRGFGLLPHGAKQRVKERVGLLSTELIRKNLNLGGLLDRLRERGPVEPLIKIPSRDRAYLNHILMKYGGIPDPKIRLTTIHGAKGREAETVIVLPDMSRATYAEYTGRDGFEAENRVGYVAVTRASYRLVIAGPRACRYYDYPTLGLRRRAA
jgi:DNA helicase-2/ATP-dependent DNA helicase PcrA